MHHHRPLSLRHLVKLVHHNQRRGAVAHGRQHAAVDGVEVVDSVDHVDEAARPDTAHLTEADDRDRHWIGKAAGLDDDGIQAARRVGKFDESSSTAVIGKAAIAPPAIDAGSSIWPATRPASTLSSPKSLTTTPIRVLGWRRRWLSSVVLPAPRWPVSAMTGIADNAPPLPR